MAWNHRLFKSRDRDLQGVVMMDRERLLGIMADENMPPDLMHEPGDNALKGLNLIAKYLPLKGISGANHDVIYSVGVEELIGAGLTEEDCLVLRRLNWMVEDEEYFACFV